jgi:hypothetical protein
LRQAHRSGQLRWQAESAFLKNYPCFNKLLSQLYELKWGTSHIGAALLDPAATVRYIGRYTKRAGFWLNIGSRTTMAKWCGLRTGIMRRMARLPTRRCPFWRSSAG